MSYSNKNTTISKTYPHFASLTYPARTPVTGQLTSAAARTLTAAELLGGLITVDTDDAQSMNLPTAAQINAALAGAHVGTSFEVIVINYGDSTLTLVVGTGITNVSISGVDSILTVALNSCVRLLFRCTGTAKDGDPTASDSYDLYEVGVSTVLS